MLPSFSPVRILCGVERIIHHAIGNVDFRFIPGRVMFFYSWQGNVEESITPTHFISLSWLHCHPARLMTEGFMSGGQQEEMSSRWFVGPMRDNWQYSISARNIDIVCRVSTTAR